MNSSDDPNCSSRLLQADGLFHYGPDDFQHTLIGVLVTRNGRMQLDQIDIAISFCFAVQVIRLVNVGLAAMIKDIGAWPGLHHPQP